MASKVIKNLMTAFALEPGEGISQRLASASITPSLLASMMNAWMDALYTDPQQDRKIKYKDYDSMDSYSDIHRALDIYSAEVTQFETEQDRSIWITSTHKDVVTILHELFDKIEVENKLRSMARHLAKYGDMFTYLIVEGDEGVQDIKVFHPSLVHRIVDVERHGKLIGFQCERLQIMPTQGYAHLVKEAEKRPVFDAWEFVHFRLGSSNLESQYGHAMLEAARHTWKELELLETAVSIYRLHRAGNRFVYYVDVGTASPEEAKDIVNGWKRGLKNKTYLRIADRQGDSNSGGGGLEGTSAFAEFLSKYNPLSLLDDIFWPIRGVDNKSRVESLGADANVSAVADIDHFKTKLRTALGVAKAYFDGDISGWNANKALAQQDIQFAKMLEPLQKSLKDGFKKLCLVHLLLLGYPPDIDFDINMASPSDLSEMQRFERMAAKQQVAASLMGLTSSFGFDADMWAHWVLQNVMGFSKSFIKKYKTQEVMPPQLEPVMANVLGDKGGVAGKSKDGDGDGVPGESDSNPGKSKSLEMESIIQSAKDSILQRRKRYLDMAEDENPDGFLVEDDDEAS